MCCEKIYHKGKSKNPSFSSRQARQKPWTFFFSLPLPNEQSNKVRVTLAQDHKNIPLVQYQLNSRVAACNRNNHELNSEFCPLYILSMQLSLFSFRALLNRLKRTSDEEVMTETMRQCPNLYCLHFTLLISQLQLLCAHNLHNHITHSKYMYNDE